ncbi:hypothetical protein MMC24_002763 [Lignoscripta atroalba]|nr:hypothetical protein [Lignoscripta atroalba]
MCYLRDGIVRLIDVHAAATAESVIDYRRFLSRRGQTYGQIELMHFSNHVLAFLHDPGPFEARVELLAIDTSIKGTRPVLLRWWVPKSSRYFVRLTSRHLYYGAYVGNRPDTDQEWKICPFDLSTNRKGIPFQLANLTGSDIGSNVVFEIMDDYFYALSNQTTLDAQEEDPTSYYRIHRFPVDDPRPERMERWLQWRRQHQEGPIHDSWTDLALRKDERSGLLNIIETRAEWQYGHESSKQRRTFYSEPIIPPSTSDTATAALIASSVSSTHSVPKSSSDTSIDSPPHYSPIDAPVDNVPITVSTPHFRLPASHHPEYSISPSSHRSFLLSKTRHRAYNPSSLAFLDVVLDSTAPTSRPDLTPQVRLRIGSRIQGPPFGQAADNDATAAGDDDGCGRSLLLRKPDVDASTGLPIEGSEERFVDRGITMWPPLDAPSELIDLLNSSGTGTGADVDVDSDERSVVYMAGRDGAAPGWGGKAIVLINFDPTVRFAGLRMGSGQAQQDGSGESRGAAFDRQGRGDKEQLDGEMPGPVDEDAPWFRRERAMWRDVDSGFQLR